MDTTAVAESQGSVEEISPVWPAPVVENFADGTWPNLDAEDDIVEKEFLEGGQILMRVVTWNLCANPPPSVDALSQSLLPKNRFHVYVVGTEECERSIAYSALNPSKKSWEAYLVEALGPNYVPIRSHTLQAIHLMAFVHKAVAHFCTVVTSAAVPTGLGSTMGNKGGVGVYFKIAQTRVLVVNAHLAAHQNAERRRNAEFNRINKMIPLLLEKKDARVSDTGEGRSPVYSPAASPVSPIVTERVDATISPVSPSISEGVVAADGGGVEAERVERSVERSEATRAADAPAAQEVPSVKRTMVAENLPVESSVAVKALIDSAPAVSEVGVDNGVDNESGEQDDVATERVYADKPVTSENSVEAVEAATQEEVVDIAAVASIETEVAHTVDTAAADTAAADTADAPDAAHADVAANAADTGSADTAADTAVGTPDAANTDNANTDNANTVADAGAGTATAQEDIRLLPTSTGNDEEVNASGSFDADDGAPLLDVPSSSTKNLEQLADLVIFMGDLNYRIKGNRKIVASLLSNSMYEVLYNNDQLRWNMMQSLVLQGFVEGPLHFRPTYKYDVGKSVYDSSSKGRIPSWTDRVLYVPRDSVKCLSYNSADDITTSDHRPVYASFSVSLLTVPDGERAGSPNNPMTGDTEKSSPVFSSESQVCTIM